MNEDLYQQLISQLFDHDEAKGDWFWEDEYSEDLSRNDEEMLEVITYLSNHYIQDIAPFTDWQIGRGLYYLFGNDYSYVYLFRDGKVSKRKRIDAILAIKQLYRDCFHPRCDLVQCHLSENSNALNDVCYMFGEIFPIYWYGIKPGQWYHQAIAEVLEFALEQDNIACIESGLHGLGHLQLYYRPCEDMIQKFIDRSPHADPLLLNYALRAKTGSIL